jgi:tetraprenyl-beta-curcumene synthase
MPAEQFLDPGAPPRQAPAALGALARANLRFWPTVAPLVARELRRWEHQAAQIADPELRVLALAKLADERFNAEVAATLATLAPAPRRARTTQAIVALELLFDYLDGRSELPCADPLADGRALFTAFTAAVDCEPQAWARSLGQAGSQVPDAAYLWALSEQAQDGLYSLPSADQVEDVAHAAAARCAEAQIRLHAACTLGDDQLERWARESCVGSGLGWREYIGGCASSVLCLHALIAASADQGTSAADARAIDAAYLAIAGVITMLDSLVDQRADEARGERGFERLFQSEQELARRLLELAREAHARALAAPNGAHHAMTLAGVIAYYTTHPGAREGHARELSLRLRRELAPTIWPTLAVMLGWRAAKRARGLVRGRQSRGGDRGDASEP